MDSAKTQLVDRLKTANSVLVTVSRDPSVDQLAACIGLTLIINKLNKHGSAVFSGNVPSTIEFLKPEETLEKSADSLRDFIIALDKSKADKLRYKVEDQMVKIFITPYRTSLGQDDFEFSQGDFNVELVIALGVQNQEDLDQAIVAHGRILHDATVACINTSQPTNLGNISWQEPTASSLCELVTDLAVLLGDKLLDEQIATALLTGIIAETDRFSNEKTSPQTMSVSASLMSAGANQQLVATNLSEPVTVKEMDGQKETEEEEQLDDVGSLNIEHNDEDEPVSATLPEPSDTSDVEVESETPDNTLDIPEPKSADDSNSQLLGSTKVVTEPPTLGGTLTANTVPEQYDPSTDPMSNMMTPSLPTDDTTSPPKTQINPSASFTPPPPSWTAPTPPAPMPPSPPLPAEPVGDLTLPPKSAGHQDDDKTLDEIEQSVDSPHQTDNDVDDAREQVETILSESPDATPEKDQALNASPLGEPLHQEPQPVEPKEKDKPLDPNNTTGLDPSLFSEMPTKDAVPPVPPPLNIPMDKPAQGKTDNNPPASSS